MSAAAELGERGAARNGGGRPSATNRLAERVAEHNRHRPAGRSAQRRLAAFRSVALTVTKRYARRREKLDRIARGSRDDASNRGATMTTTFDKREEGFEKQFAHDEELKFKATARRDRLLG